MTKTNKAMLATAKKNEALRGEAGDEQCESQELEVVFWVSFDCVKAWN
jgi:hypothetical protein